MRVHKGKLFTSFFLGMCLMSAAGWTLPVTSSQAKSDPTEEPALIVLLAAGQTSAPDAVVAGVNSGHSPIDILSTGSPVSARLGITQQLVGQIDPERPEARLQRYIVLTYPPGTNLDDIKVALLADPRIEAVGENLRGSYSAAATDPLFPPPPGGDPTQYQWGSYTLNLPAAWDRIKGHAYVGLVDVGIMVDHPDLRAFHVDGGTTYYDGGNYRPQFSWNFDQFNYGSDIDELGAGNTTGFASHGTHTSGIIAATPNNGIGVAGACWHCSLMMARDFWTRASEIAEAITWLASHGAQVINYSGLSPLAAGKDCSNLTSQDAGAQMICDALDFADWHDVVLTMSSGNDLNDIDFPARDPRVIAVGGVQAGNPPPFWQESVCPAARGVPNLTGTQQCGSNYTVTAGRRMQDLMAPAKDVLSTTYTNHDWNPGLGCGDHFPQGVGAPDPTPGYGTCTGTSMSAPYVAGISGLLRSANPLLWKGNIRSILLSHADRAGAWDPQYGYGVPDAGASVAAALGTVGGRVLPNRLTPLFSLYSDTAKDYFYTTVPQMAAAAVSGNLNGTCDPQAGGSCTTPPALVPYLPVGPTVHGYPQFPSSSTVFPAASVYIFTTEAPPFAGAPPLVPLYRMSYKDPTPGSLHRDVTYTTDTTGILAFKSVGYELDGIEGYIYAPCTPEPGCIPPGAVHLHRRYNPQRDDFAIFPDSELTQMLNQGYTSTGGASEIIGYVYPNIDSDGDGLIDGFELLIGTNPLVADSDCDGLTDGQELLNYPYTDPLGPGCAGSPVWVSTKGDDGNSCSYSAPCRTFAGALLRIASGGEIDVLDSGDFGPLAINKSVSVISAGPLGGIQAATGNAITINAGPNDKVVLRGLTLDGLGTGTTGVSFLSGGSLYIENCTINNFLWGVDFAPTNGSGKLWVTDSIVRNNGFASGGGVHLIATTGPGFAASIDGLRAEGNGAGVKAESQGTVTVRNSFSTSNGWAGFTAYTSSGGTVQMLVENSVSTHNGTIGVQSNGSGATVTLSNVVVTDNPTGLGIFNSGAILSFGNNRVQGNTTDGAPSQTITTH